MSDEEVIEEPVRFRINEILGAVIGTLLVIVFMIVTILFLLQRGDYLYSALIGIAVIIAIFMIRKLIQRAQRYEEALANRPVIYPEKEEEIAVLKCPKCDRDLSPAFKQCPFCGYELKTVKCPNCGTEFPKSFNLCPYCGAKVRKTPKEKEKKHY